MRADLDAGREPGVTSEARVEIKRLKKQIVALEKAHEILWLGACFSPLGFAAPHRKIALADVTNDRFGVEFAGRTVNAAVVGSGTALSHWAARSMLPAALFTPVRSC